MSEAIHNPVKRQYNKREVHTSELPVGQSSDVDLDAEYLVRGEAFEPVRAAPKEHLENLAFMEEPVQIRIDNTSNTEVPETHIPCWVNGKYAECLIDGKWVPIGWLPTDQVLTVKRKYLEVLARSKTTSIANIHPEQGAEIIHNKIVRSTKSNFAITVMNDSPKGHDWMRQIKLEGA